MQKQIFKNARLDRIAQFLVKHAQALFVVGSVLAIFGISFAELKITRKYYFDPLPKTEVPLEFWAPPYFKRLTQDGQAFVKAVQTGDLARTVPLEKLKACHDPTPEGKNQYVVLRDGSIVYISWVKFVTYTATVSLSNQEWESFCDAAQLNSRLTIVRENPRIEGNHLFFATTECGSFEASFFWFMNSMWILLKVTFFYTLSILAILAICMLVRDIIDKRRAKLQAVQ